MKASVQPRHPLEVSTRQRGDGLSLSRPPPPAQPSAPRTRSCSLWRLRSGAGCRPPHEGCRARADPQTGPRPEAPHPPRCRPAREGGRDLGGARPSPGVPVAGAPLRSTHSPCLFGWPGRLWGGHRPVPTGPRRGRMPATHSHRRGPLPEPLGGTASLGLSERLLGQTCRGCTICHLRREDGEGRRPKSEPPTEISAALQPRAQPSPPAPDAEGPSRPFLCTGAEGSPHPAGGAPQLRRTKLEAPPSRSHWRGVLPSHTSPSLTFVNIQQPRQSRTKAGAQAAWSPPSRSRPARMQEAKTGRLETK